ncbi:MAG: RDD family protein [Spirochaetaceae bacterium]|jgi:uncharacterized RDD family membrane protein YckC|nr:RDD family protein [Spirochaetaceae bacterium]
MGSGKNQDTSFSVLTPEGIEFALYPAGLLIRVAACGIDSVVRFFLLLAVRLGVSMVASLTGRWFTMLLWFVISWFYHVFCEIMFRGQSIGKRVLGLRVVQSDGSPVGPGSSLLRNLLRFADNFMGLYYIALFSVTVSPGFRRPGDWAADTLVVYTANAQAPARRADIAWIDRFKKISPGRGLSYEEKQAILSFAGRYPLLGPDRAEELARIYVPSLPDGPEENTAEYLLGIAHTLSGS